ncbi:MAG: type II toxin-antitoxin system VapB family antitoxin [Burkholderiales bacterium]
MGGHRTKKATVNEALQEYIQRRRQARVLKLFGTIDFDPAYDYKKQRRRKSTFSWTLRYGRWRFGALERLTGASSTSSAS